MDFIRDLAENAKLELDRLSISYSDISDSRAIIDRWANAKLKMISNTSRSIRMSSVVSKRDISTNQQKALESIKEKCIQGEDLNPYQGKGLFTPDFTDYLWADWGIHHFHLSTLNDKKNKYFMDRSDMLLFVMFKETIAYFIDIRPHKESYVFAQKELLQILHTEAPDLISAFAVKGALDISNVIDDPEIIEGMRKAGIQVIQKVEDTIYGPMGGGITTAATAGKLTIEVDRLYRRLWAAENWIQNNEEIIKAKFNEAIGRECSTLDLCLKFTDEGIIVIDRNSGCIFQLDQIA